MEARGWRFSLGILLTGVPGMIIGASVILNVPGRLAELALVLLTMSLGVNSWLRKDPGRVDCAIHRTKPGYFIGAAALFGIGILNGSLTLVTGLFVTLWLVRWFGLESKRAEAYTLVLVGLFWNGSSALTLGLLGTIRWDWIPVLLVASALGGMWGPHWSIKKGNKAIKRVYEVVTVLVGVKLIVGWVLSRYATAGL